MSEVEMWIVIHTNSDSAKETSLEGVFPSKKEAVKYIFKNGGRYFEKNGTCIFGQSKKEIKKNFQCNAENFIEWGEGFDCTHLFKTNLF